MFWHLGVHICRFALEILRLRSIKTKLSHLQISPSLGSHTVKGPFLLSETQQPKPSALPHLFLPLWESLFSVAQICRDSTNLAHFSRHDTNLVFTNTLRKLVWEGKIKVKKKKNQCSTGVPIWGRNRVRGWFCWTGQARTWKGRLRTFFKDINLLLKYKIIYLNAARVMGRISQP